MQVRNTKSLKCMIYSENFPRISYFKICNIKLETTNIQNDLSINTLSFLKAFIVLFTVSWNHVMGHELLMWSRSSSLLFLINCVNDIFWKRRSVIHRHIICIVSKKKSKCRQTCDPVRSRDYIHWHLHKMHNSIRISDLYDRPKIRSV